MTSWVDPKEEMAYNRLKELRDASATIKLQDTSRALSLLLKKRESTGNWEWGVFEDAHDTFKLEFSQMNTTYKEGFEILDNKIFKALFDAKLKKGKKVIDFVASMPVADKERVDDTLGFINARSNKLLHGCKDEETLDAAALLAGLSLIARYETKGRFIRSKLIDWMVDSNSVSDPNDRESIAEDFVKIKLKGSDGKSDTHHIRNSFAHAHFNFLGNQKIHLWDHAQDDPTNITFDIEINISDLFEICNMYEKKLAMVEMYSSLMMATQDLYLVYKKDWKQYSRQ
jgi:hypothetical protein